MRSELCAQARARVAGGSTARSRGRRDATSLRARADESVRGFVGQTGGRSARDELEAMGLALGLPRGVLSRAAEGAFCRPSCSRSRPVGGRETSRCSRAGTRGPRGRQRWRRRRSGAARDPCRADQPRHAAGMTHRRHGSGTAGSGEAVDHPEDHFVRVQALLELHRHSGIADGGDEDGDERRRRRQRRH